MSFVRYGTRRSRGVTVSPPRLPCVTMDFVDSGLYRGITDYAHGTPAWVRLTAEIGTEAGLLVFVALFVAGWWRARHSGTRTFAIAVLAPLATAVAYVCSEVLKSWVTEERPCRTVTGAAPPLVECPPARLEGAAHRGDGGAQSAQPRAASRGRRTRPGRLPVGDGDGRSPYVVPRHLHDDGRARCVPSRVGQRLPRHPVQQPLGDR
ncbi:conserved hypothetical protein, partial [Streptomyces griseoflavus Tu4000]